MSEMELDLYNFVSFIYEEDNKKYLLYSCIQRSSSLKAFSLKTVDTIEFNALGKVLVLKARINLMDWKTLESSISTNILNGLYFDNMAISIVDKRSYYQMDQLSSDNFTRFQGRAPESLSSYTEYVKVYYTEHQVALLDYLESLSYLELKSFKNDVLGFVEKSVGLRMATSYSYRIGCFEVHSVKVKSFPELLSNHNGVTLRKPSNNSENLMVHIVLRDVEEIVFDKLLTLSQKSLFYEVEYNFNTAEMTVFTEEGDLLHKECNHYIESISMGMNMISSPSYQINDKLTKKLQGESQEKAKKIVSNSKNISSTIDYDKSLYKKSKHRIYDLFLKTSPITSKLKGGFFLKYENIDEKGEAFTWLISLINSSQHVTIIDPYFSSKVVTESLRRVKSGINIHVITSLSTHNEFSEEDTISGFKQTLKECMNEIKCTLKIENHTRANGKKLFHDRFIIIRNGNEKNVYMLSNSLSGYCESFPFTYMPLDMDTSEKVLDYFEKLDWDIKREVLWDSSLFSEKTNTIFSYNQETESTFTSTWFLAGISHIVNEESSLLLKVYHWFFKGWKKVNKDILALSKGMITKDGESFIVDTGLFSEQIQKNVFLSHKTFSSQDLACILMVSGELCARSHSERTMEDIIKWLKTKKKSKDLQEVFNEVCLLSKNIIYEKTYSLDVVIPEIKSVKEFFEYAENAFIYGLRDIHKHWGLLFSSYFLIRSQSINISQKDLSSEILNNIFAGYILDVICRYDFFDRSFGVNLIQSNTLICKIMGMVYITTSLDDSSRSIEIFEENNISKKLIVFSLARRYKEYMHRYYRALGDDERIAEILSHLDDISENACAIWDTIELEQDEVEEIYSCFFDKNEFIYRFGMYLTNLIERNKLFMLVLERLESNYGWKSLEDLECHYYDQVLLNINWAGAAYLDIYKNNLMNGLLSWNSKFIIPAKLKLEEPLYKGNTTQLADRLASLLFFVSEFLLRFLQQGGDLSKIFIIIKELYKHTNDLFESDKCHIYAVNENMYHTLLANLSQLLISLNDTSFQKNELKQFPISNYLLCVSKDYMKLEEEGPLKLQEIVDNSSDPVYYAIKWIVLMCNNLYLEKKEVPNDIIEKYIEILEEAGISDKHLLDFPTEMMKLLKGDISEITLTLKNKIITLNISQENLENVEFV
ncbi:VPA1262 family N-terminal domain-containing protein [Sulfurovum sp.]|uniref:VPA1262 family N-terminal domain-containing protein n=1 Tax=Sulfurovum sp. TaxID=1969726 RepID=UPI003569A72E